MEMPSQSPICNLYIAQLSDYSFVQLLSLTVRKHFFKCHGEHSSLEWPETQIGQKKKTSSNQPVVCINQQNKTQYEEVFLSTISYNIFLYTYIDNKSEIIFHKYFLVLSQLVFLKEPKCIHLIGRMNYMNRLICSYHNVCKLEQEICNEVRDLYNNSFISLCNIMFIDNLMVDCL